MKVRWVVAVAVVLATTLGGLSTQRATASGVPLVSVKRSAPEPTDIPEIVFAFGDVLDAVNYEVGFLPEARDESRLTAACRTLFSEQPRFEAALASTDKAKDIARDLIDAAEPTLELCFAPLSADENAEAQAIEGFAEFHERAFDYATALGD